MSTELDLEDDLGLLPPDDEDVTPENDSPAYDDRSHYEKVGKSKLRRLEEPRLGKKYEGTTVARKDLDDRDHGIISQESEESDIDSLSQQSDQRTDLEDDDSVVNSRWNNGNGHGSRSPSEEDIDMLDPNSDEEILDSSSGSSVENEPDKRRPETARATLQDLFKNDIARVAASLSHKDDVKQGLAVKRQQAAYDRLLDSRIKLQKALLSSNNLSHHTITDSTTKAAIAEAESAALSLWSTIDSLRCAMLSSNVADGDDDKVPLDAEPLTPLNDLWIHSKSVESISIPHRRTTLNQWSSRTRASAASTVRSKVSGRVEKEPAFSLVVDEYLKKEEAKKIEEPSPDREDQDGPVGKSIETPPAFLNFDDSQFYQHLLRDLISSRTRTGLPPSISTNSILPSDGVGKPKPINNQKNRRGIDTKASKGRKLRYTTHEKLVSFMAPEDRTTWSEAARREFFGSLFGGHSTLNPQDIDLDEMEGDPDSTTQDREEQALRLFRTQHLDPK
jgi:protein AATF/BFR2